MYLHIIFSKKKCNKILAIEIVECWSEFIKNKANNDKLKQSNINKTAVNIQKLTNKLNDKNQLNIKSQIHLYTIFWKDHTIY